MKKISVWVITVVLMVSASTVFPGAAQNNADVTIIVVDDFSEDESSALDPDQYESTDNCAVSLEGQAYWVRGVSADPIEIPHGELVYDQIETLLAEAEATDLI